MIEFVYRWTIEVVTETHVEGELGSYFKIVLGIPCIVSGPFVATGCINIDLTGMNAS